MRHWHFREFVNHQEREYYSPISPQKCSKRVPTFLSFFFLSFNYFSFLFIFVSNEFEFFTILVLIFTIFRALLSCHWFFKNCLPFIPLRLLQKRLKRNSTSSDFSSVFSANCVAWYPSLLKKFLLPFRTYFLQTSNRISIFSKSFIAFNYPPFSSRRSV